MKDFITKEIPVLKSSDTGEYALALMDDFKLKHLPLVSDGVYRGLVSEKDLLSISDLSQVIGEPILFAPSVPEHGHLHETLTLITQYQLSLLPVITEEGLYCGSILREKLVDVLSELCGATREGSVIVIEVAPQDYMLSDIARLVESNNAHVQSLLSHTEAETGRLIITIKIDLKDASPVIRSFERFNYTVLAYYMENGVADEVLEQRMDELLFYMNM